MPRSQWHCGHSRRSDLSPKTLSHFPRAVCFSLQHPTGKFCLCSCLSLSLPPPSLLLGSHSGHHLTCPKLEGLTSPKPGWAQALCHFPRDPAPVQPQFWLLQEGSCTSQSSLPAGNSPAKAGATGSSWCVDPSQGGERDLELQNEASVTQIKRFLIPFPSASPGRGGAASHTHTPRASCTPC